MVKLGQRPWGIAIIYVVVSLAIEALAMLIGRLSPPRDNAILAPIVLTIPPLVTAWLSGYRHPRALMTVAFSLAALTLLLTVLVNRLTGISTGLLEPLVNRTLAGLAVGLFARRITG